MAEEQEKGGIDPGAIDSLAKKLQEFSEQLEPEERILLSQIVESGGAGTGVRPRPSPEDFQNTLNMLRASLKGRMRLRDDDDGFWARWEQRQY